jgi:hypothetical protein
MPIATKRVPKPLTPRQLYNIVLRERWRCEGTGTKMSAKLRVAAYRLSLEALESDPGNPYTLHAAVTFFGPGSKFDNERNKAFGDWCDENIGGVPRIGVKNCTLYFRNVSDEMLFNLRWSGAVDD